MRILMILAPDRVPPPWHLRLERFLAPYYVFQRAGAEIVIASPEGGAALDRLSTLNDVPEALRRQFLADGRVREAVSDTLRLDQIFPGDFAAAFSVGLPGEIWGQPGSDMDSRGAGPMLARFLAAGKPVASVPSPAILAPHGAGEGVLIAGDAAGSPEKAARALLAALGAPDPQDEGARSRAEELLDEALTETFPASDPIARSDFR